MKQIIMGILLILTPPTVFVYCTGGNVIGFLWGLFQFIACIIGTILCLVSGFIFMTNGADELRKKFQKKD